MPSQTPSEEILRSLVHDLRQPLGNLETSVFYLDLVLDEPQGRVREQLRTMEHQIAQAAALLHRAAEELRRLQDQRENGGVAVANRDLTKSATAAGA